MILIFFLISCQKEEKDARTAGNNSFRQLIPISDFAAASTINVSKNGKYMVFSKAKSSSGFTHYYSKDGGETVQEFELVASSYNSYGAFNTNISNNGLIVAGQKGVYDLNNLFYGGGANYSALAVTESGKMVEVQTDGANGLTFFLNNNGTLVNTGVQLTMDKAFFVGASQEKLGFFDHENKTIAEFDVNTQTYSSATLSLDYSAIGGFGQNEGSIKTAYHNGYFAYAKSEGLLIIAPDQSVTYYTYPPVGASYLNTVQLALFEDVAYVLLADGKVYKAENGAITEQDFQFPIHVEGTTRYTQGFLEGADRLRSGIIKTEGTSSRYLPLSMEYAYPGYAMFEKTFLIGDYALTEDKIYHVPVGAYYPSPMGNIVNVFNEPGRSIAFADSGVFTSPNGKDWQLANSTTPPLELVTKGKDGVYHGLDILKTSYQSPGGGAITRSVEMVAYTSSNGTDWQKVEGSETNKAGSGPSLIASDGIVYTYNDNVDGGEAFLSRDYGVTWNEGIVNNVFTSSGNPVPSGFKTSEFELSNGAFLWVDFEFDGEMLLRKCSQSTGGCSEEKSNPAFNTLDMYQFEKEITLSNNDELVLTTIDGIYVSNSMR